MKACFPTLAILLGFCQALAAAEKTPFPRLGTAHVYVSEVDDVYQGVRDEIERVSKSSPRQYYVVVVNTCGSGEFSTRDYCYDLDGTWMAEASRAGLPYADEQRVLIVLAVKDRGWSILCGKTLQAEYGLRGQDIDRNLTERYLLPHAKQGDLDRGLAALVDGMESWIAEKDQERLQAQQAEQARQAEVQRDAQEAVEGAKRTLQSAEQELAAKRTAGFTVEPMQAQVREAALAIEAASKQLAADPPRANEAAHAADQTLQQAIVALQKLPLLQTEALAGLQRLENRAHELEDQSQSLRRDGYAIGPVLDLLRRGRSAIPEAATSAQTDPAMSLRIQVEADKCLQEASSLIINLPQMKTDLQAEEKTARQNYEQVGDMLAQLRDLGGDVGSQSQRWQGLAGAIKKAGELGTSDYGTATAELRSVVAALKALQSELSTQLQQRTEEQTAQAQREQFLTRTLPGSLALGLASLIVLVFAVLRLVHGHWKGKVSRHLAEYKQQVVSLSDRLDALKERHKMLPFTDADYKEPMAGETLAVYNAAQTALNEYREKWLGLMDVWQRAQALLGDETPFGNKKSQEVGKILAEARVPNELAGIEEQCARPLDQLEEAHEQSAENLSAAQQARDEAAEQIKRVQEAALPTESYQAAMRACDELLSQGGGIRIADPLGASSIWKQARDRASSLVAQIQAILEQLAQSQAAQEKLDDVTSTCTQRRAQGMLLTEPEGNPDPSLQVARDRLSAVRAALELGDVASAAQSLSQAVTAIDRAAAVIERQVEARTFCEAQVVARQAESRKLQSLCAEARGQTGELESQFAPQSFSAVASNGRQAQDQLAALEPHIAEAGKLCLAETQHYFRAAALLQAVAQQQQACAGLLALIGGRLQELRQLRSTCQAQVAQVRGESDRVGQMLRANSADRPQSNQRFLAATQAVQQVASEMEASRPDWPTLAGRLQQARSDLQDAEKMAQEDIRLQQQATSELAIAEREIRRMASFYQDGISVNASSAEATLARARQELVTQNYEQSVQFAHSANQQALSAYNDAVRQVQVKQERQERERRERMLASIAAAATVAMSSRPTFGGVPGTFNIGQPSGHSPHSSPSMSGSQAAAGSWSSPSPSTSHSAASGASQGRW